MDAAPQDEGQELPHWLRPGQRVPPQEALRHIQGLCAAWPDLYAALFVVLATHQELPREVLAVAIKQFRADLDAFTREDVVSLLTAVWNGGKSGFEAVLRTRANSPKRAASLSWVKD
ncbi:hypothetical protein [Roseateles sp. BYS87W]|uniref:Uncharacterized protein n=1 Tax=Pelomonas baiyunensis TaxID=3299026 RepID=A0ABW7GT90_9BURK